VAALTRNNKKEVPQNQISRRFDIARVTSKLGGGLWIWAAIVILIAIAVVISFLAEQLEDRLGLQWDLTRNRVYSISEATKGTLALLNQDVTIYTLYPAGKEDMTIGELLRRYEIASDRITVENIDPVSSPLFTRQFQKDDQEIADNSLIVAFSGEEGDYRVIQAENLYEWEMEDDRIYITALVAEQRITSAIESLMGGEQPTAYFVEGHNESSLSSLYYLEDLLTNDEYIVDNYDLVYNNMNLTENDLLLFVAPKEDLRDEEVKVLEDFFRMGGKAVFLFDIFMSEDIPNFTKVMDMFGVGLDPELVVEGDSDRFLENPVILTPMIVEASATQMLREAGTYAIMPRCRPVTLKTKSNVENVPLYRTSDDSYGKTDPSASSTEKEDGDRQGPFVLAAAAEDSKSDARVVVFGSTDFVSSLETVRVAGNLAAFMGAVSWANDQQSSVVVQPKSMVDPPLQISSTGSAMALMILVIAVIPILLVVCGVIVWRRRVVR
jgi:hypothetical protein